MEIDAIQETAGAAALEMAVSAIVERGGKIGPCTNCAAPMIGPYCAVCGQAVDTYRRSVFHLIHDFFKDLLSFDSRILRTLHALLFQPGELSLAFRQGRTQRYVPAVRLYLFTSLIFFLALSVAGIAILQLQLVTMTSQIIADKIHNVFIIENGIRTPMRAFKADDKGNVYAAEPGASRKLIPGMKTDGSLKTTISTEPHFFSRFGSVKTDVPARSRVLNELDKELRSEVGRSKNPGSWIAGHAIGILKALATDPAAINGLLTEWIPRMLFILLPLFALLLGVFYWRQRKQFYFVDHLVFSLNYHTFGFTLLLVAAALAQIMAGGTVAAVVFFSIGFYLLLAMKRFYGQSWFWTFAKFSLIGFTYLFFLLPTLIAVIIVSLWRV